MTVEPLLTEQEVRRITRLSKTKNHETMHSAGFPLIRLGRSLRVEPDALRDWIAAQAHRGDAEH